MCRRSLSYLFEVIQGVLTDKRLSSECIRNGAGVHNLHGSDQPVSGGTVLGGTVLHDAVHAGDRLAVWYTGRRHHVAGGHEAVSQPSERGYHWGESLGIICT